MHKNIKLNLLRDFRNGLHPRGRLLDGFQEIIAKTSRVNTKGQCNQIHIDELKDFLILIESELDRLTFLKYLFYCCQFIYILQGEALVILLSVSNNNGQRCLFPGGIHFSFIQPAIYKISASENFLRF